MIPLTKEVTAQLTEFMSGEGAAAIETLGTVLLEYFLSQCMEAEGNQVYREQGAAQLAKWLKNLPKGLQDGRISSFTSTMG